MSLKRFVVLVGLLLCSLSAQSNVYACYQGTCTSCILKKLDTEDSMGSLLCREYAHVGKGELNSYLYIRCKDILRHEIELRLKQVELAKSQQSAFGRFLRF